MTIILCFAMLRLGAYLMNDERLAGWKRNALSLAAVAACLKDFAARIIGHVERGGTLDDAAFAEIKAACVLSLKNSITAGLPIEDEAEAIGNAIETVQQFMDSAIAEGREPNNC
jgi:hypothetical protein